MLATVGLKSVVPMHIHIITFVGTVLLCLVAASIPFRKISQIDPALVFGS